MDKQRENRTTKGQRDRGKIRTKGQQTTGQRDDKRTKEQRNKGTKGQRNKGTKEQRNKGTN